MLSFNGSLIYFKLCIICHQSSYFLPYFTSGLLCEILIQTKLYRCACNFFRRFFYKTFIQVQKIKQFVTEQKLDKGPKNIEICISKWSAVGFVFLNQIHKGLLININGATDNKNKFGVGNIKNSMWNLNSTSHLLKYLNGA